MSNTLAPAAPEHASPFEALRAGWRVVLSIPTLGKIYVLLLFLLLILMFPFGRMLPDSGGILAPLTVDSGYLFRDRPGADFYSVYDAGARILEGRDPYSVNEDTGKAGVRAPYVATFRYLPIAAFLFAVPLNILPPVMAFFTWCVFNLEFLLANFLLCCGRRPRYWPLFAIIWFAWFPVIAELHMGQFTLFMATMMLWGFDALASGRNGGMVGWAGAVFLKVYPIAMVPSLWLWGRRGWVATTVLIVLTTTIGWKVVAPAGIDEGLGNRGVGGRLVGGSRMPYAGAQGTQELVNVVVWKIQGRSFTGQTQEIPSPFSDPTFLLNGFLLGSFSLLLVYTIWKTRKSFSLPAVGMFWLLWFVAYVDCWEHHYVLFQALLGLLLMRGIIDWRLGLCLYVFAGGPSLWWLWQRTGYSGNTLTEMIGVAYFIQRPVAVFLLMGVLTSILMKLKSEEHHG